MSKQKKKKGGKAQLDTLNLTAAILNPITAILLLIEKLIEQRRGRKTSPL